MKHKKKVLITGSRGLLGLALLQTLKDDYHIVPTVHTTKKDDSDKTLLRPMDICNGDEVHAVFNHHAPDVVVHAASIGNVDYCERNKEEAYRANVEGTDNIIHACKEHGSMLIFISSNAVFDGSAAPYTEESTPNPINYYGQTKAIAEEHVQSSGLKYAIARLILMYGWNHPSERHNPVTWLLNALHKKERVKLVNDTYTNPIYNIQAGEAIKNMIRQRSQGIFHLAGGERMNRYDFGRKTAEVFGYDHTLIEPVDSDYFAGIAPRMPDTTYATKRMQDELHVTPMTIAEGLEHMKLHRHIHA